MFFGFTCISAYIHVYTLVFQIEKCLLSVCVSAAYTHMDEKYGKYVYAVNAYFFLGGIFVFSMCVYSFLYVSFIPFQLSALTHTHIQLMHSSTEKENRRIKSFSEMLFGQAFSLSLSFFFFNFFPFCFASFYFIRSVKKDLFVGLVFYAPA